MRRSALDCAQRADGGWTIKRKYLILLNILFLSY